MSDTERHVMVDTPSWDTKVRCSCGEDFTSRAEFYKHGYEALSSRCCLQSTCPEGSDE